MKNAVLFSLALLLGFAACQNAHSNHDESKPETTTAPAPAAEPAPTATAAPEAVFACPMHPEVTGKSGDKCPKCKMNLEEKKTPEVVYACPMHPEVTGKKGDKCSKCKMDLEEKK